jgi:hypothetical protein
MEESRSEYGRLFTTVYGSKVRVRGPWKKLVPRTGPRENGKWIGVIKSKSPNLYNRTNVCTRGK